MIQIDKVKERKDYGTEKNYDLSLFAIFTPIFIIYYTSKIYFINWETGVEGKDACACAKLISIILPFLYFIRPFI
jgi:hypothetical protein